MKKLVLFDCDQTLRTSVDGDYVSSIDSPFKKISQTKVERIDDRKIFILQPGTKEFILHLKKHGYKIGIISDNSYEIVNQILSAFGLVSLIDPQYVSVKLRKGYCPKHLMIAEMLGNDIDQYQISRFDDKDYEQEASKVGVKFFLVNAGINYLNYIKIFN